jgi:(R,R)-butanediol dehydrogenase/meso-butanediol dehydrogenase/diacetyl reductase
LAATGKYPIEKVVTATIDIDDVVAKGFEVLTNPNGDQMKVLVKVKK